MSVQDSVLQILANEAADWVSGEDIAAELGVSRAAVWKAIQKLQDGGLEVEGTRSKGYRLQKACDPLTERGILAALGEEARAACTLCVKQSTGSTNNDLREMAEAGAAEFSCVVAGEQVAGKGRRGRSFFSLGDTGVYFSMLIKPAQGMQQAGLITGGAAVAVCRALESVCGLEAQIKWVNDVYLGKRKVCGILTEAVASLENGSLAYAIVGIGVNVYTPSGGWPEEIARRAGCVLEELSPNMRNRLAAAIISECYSIYAENLLQESVADYQRLSLMPGREVQVMDAKGQARQALALAVNGDLSLKVRYVDGSEEDLQSGEVSIAL